MNSNDMEILRDLAKKYSEICQKDIQAKRRKLWRSHNSLKPTRIPIYVRVFAWPEMAGSHCRCKDPFYRAYENFFRESIFRDKFNDDFTAIP